MRTYHGKRSGDTKEVLIHNGHESAPSPLPNTYGNGSFQFDWGYEGEGPAVLAHSLLVDAVGLLSIDVFYEQFMMDVIALLPLHEWELSQAEVLDYAKKKYIEDSFADMSKDSEARADEALQNTVGFVKEMQALAWQSDFSKGPAQERLLCDSEDEKAFSPWYHIHPKADQTKDQILFWLKECEEETSKNQ